ncbi:hypothetical protein [Nocardia sp. NPDC004415]
MWEYLGELGLWVLVAAAFTAVWGLLRFGPAWVVADLDKALEEHARRRRAAEEPAPTDTVKAPQRPF